MTRYRPGYAGRRTRSGAVSALLVPALCTLLLGAAAWRAPDPAVGPILTQILAERTGGATDIVYAVRETVGPHWYENIGYYSNEPNRPAFATSGGRLCRLNMRTGKVTNLLDDPTGGVRDPQVHYNGHTILFSYRRGGTSAYHLYTVEADGTRLKQLTDGDDDDIEPCYLPDGGIIFCSTRCHRYVNCWYTRVTTLHRCDGDGRNIRMLSSNVDHDNTPWVLPDGRILYMRWEYVDRSQVDFHHLWTMNPDGTGQRIYYGNQRPGTVMLDAKPIPGTNRVAAIFSPGHGMPEHSGFINEINPGGGPDDPAYARLVSQRWNVRDPFPLAADAYLASSGRKILAFDGKGVSELVYELDDPNFRLEVHEPRLLAPRPREAVISPHVNLKVATGRMVLEDIYQGRNMAGVNRGDVKKLLILRQLPKPVNFSGGMEPLTLGGSFTLAQVLGTVPVEPDGSANFEAPALQSLFMVALDADDLSVKRMQSFVTLEPGETQSCVGCHERRTVTPTSTRRPMALNRPPSRIEPLVDVPDITDFPRDIQPILDRRCVECHNSDRREARVNLSSDRTGSYTFAYETLTYWGLFSDGRNLARGNRPPRSIGSSASRLLKLGDGTHHGARFVPGELKVVRTWIEAGATFPGTYAALGSGMVGVGLPYDELRARCGSCHANRAIKEPKNAQEALALPGLGTNLTAPLKSTLLTAPLSREAGGTGACRSAVYSGASDPLYQAVLGAITGASRRLADEKRFDMPGFVPNEHYLREVRKFAGAPTAGANLDPYQLDRAYWARFDVKPR